VKKRIVILGSDAVNRYNMRFLPSSLEQALRQKWQWGTPSSLGHDQTKPIGWMHPISLYFEPSVTRLVGSFSAPETEAEVKELNQALLINVQQENQDMCKPYETKLRERLGTTASDKAVLWNAGCAALLETNLAVRAFPSLFAGADKDGLIDITPLKHLGAGVFEMDGLALFAHRQFRRSASLLNSINYHFYENYEELRSMGSCLRIALDPDLVGEPSSFRTPIELAYWWGPPFVNDLKSIPAGVTQYASTDFERLYSGTIKSEFWWQSRKGQHILEMEELKDADLYSEQETICCRYLHCIIDEMNGDVLHLDGAVRCYSPEGMRARLNVDISKSERNTKYHKLWRIDTNIPLETWKRLVSDYFRDNHLVGEYLGAAKASSTEQPQSDLDLSYEISAKQKYVPYGIDKGSGLRLNLSYHQLRDDLSADRTVIPMDTIGEGEAKKQAIDLWTVELRKILLRMGKDLFIPSGVDFFICEDLYLNLPLIVHRNNSLSEIAVTLESIRTLIKWSEGSEHDRAICVNIAYPVSDRELRISIYGHCADLLKGLDNLFGKLPIADPEIEQWVDHVSTTLSGQILFDRPLPHFLLRDSEMLWFKRYYVPQEFNPKFEYIKSKGISCGLELPAGDPLYDAMKKGDIQFGICCIVKRVTCSKCGKSFFDCRCSVVLDGVTKILGDITPIGFFFTDKPSQITTIDLRNSEA
jgi:hypothetical protein